eukprot:TRINITY_DN8595_c0_g1::TRINITY_DN8595_c0_g1_i1::g.8621::m.8621 TRINITY_DN8595_c0_g1::TRINITY_DN8595_c0_g1_i1::g.8621  ORF type:complete len:356 (+),score=59.61,sp/O28608/ALADH_ARCFU/35.87/2e-58,OCD_Mu_crystall/PF02423.10/5.6e-78,Shikimate_DH/PF01488.15/6e+03,Shikimate_DH/PF01488.15/2.7e-06,NmrA/PF05368.8/0.018 TRINITY_DN8595_c0_g1_i1:66-1070(+)
MARLLRILNRAEVVACLSMEDAIKVNAEAFRQLSLHQATVPAYLSIESPEHDGSCLIKPARMSNGLGHGLKVVAVRPKNAALGLPTVPGMVILMDDETGLPLSLMDGTYLTGMRTAAGSAVATEKMSLPFSRVLTIFGAGTQAKFHVDAIRAVRNIEHVNIINRSLRNASELARDFHAQHGLEVCAIGLDDESRVEAAVRASQIICTTTNSVKPLFSSKWLSPGTHINCIGSYLPQMQEVDIDTVKMARVVVDDAQVAWKSGDLHIPLEAKVITKNHVVGEIGHVVAGVVAGRTSPEEITMFKSVGTAAQDVATAQIVFQNAEKLQLGTTVALF